MKTFSLRDGLETRRRNERPLCWWCGQPGHLQRDCRQRPPGETGQDSRTRTGVSEPSRKRPRYAVKVLAEWAKGSLIADGWIQEKPCQVTIDTGASATVARPDIVAGLPERELGQPYVLQTASGETIPAMKEAHVELTLGQRTLSSWVFVADIADEFILGLDLLRACDASVDIGRRVLRLGQDEVPVRDAPTAAVLKRTRPAENRRNEQPVRWQSGRTGHLGRGCPRGPAEETVDGSDWERDFATGRSDEARGRMAEPVRAPSYLTHQSDEKGRLAAYVVALEGQIEGQKARLAELEAAQERKAGATTGALKVEDSEAERQRRVTCRRVRVVAAAAPDERGRAALRRGQLTKDRAEAHQDRRIDSAGATEGDRVRPHRPARRGKKKASRGLKHHSDRKRGPPDPAPA